MRELQQVQHFVAVLGADGSATELWTEVGAEVRVFGPCQSRLKEYVLVARTVKDVRPDAVILWTPSRLGVKVAACHNAGVRRIVAHVGNPIRLSFKNKVAAEAYTLLPGGRKATLIPVSQHVQQSYSGKSGFRHYSSHLIYNAIDMEQFQYEPQTRLPTDVRAGMIARLDPIKDHATLLHAWSIVLRRRPNWHLEFAGDGPSRPMLEELAERLGISTRVSFLGWVTDIPEAMRNWSIVVHSTTREEGLGNSMLEAMALGRPLVATDIGPVAEVTDNGRLARMPHVGDPEDMARQILDVEADWTRTRNLVAAAREWAEQKFVPRRMVNEYMRCLSLEIRA
jgi:glycosyltransferase involved in cell wall biosynthesis